MTGKQTRHTLLGPQPSLVPPSPVFPPAGMLVCQQAPANDTVRPAVEILGRPSAENMAWPGTPEPHALLKSGTLPERAQNAVPLMCSLVDASALC
jgi:hypothetical protein